MGPGRVQGGRHRVEVLLPWPLNLETKEIDYEFV